MATINPAPELTREQELRDYDEVRDWILAWVERELRIPAKEISTDTSLLNYGMDSVNAIMLVGDLESQMNLRLPSTLVWDHQTIDALAEVVFSDALPATESQQAIDPTAEHFPKLSSLSRQEVANLLQNIDILSDEEVSKLLDHLSQE